jgi:hypothetical protein
VCVLGKSTEKKEEKRREKKRKEEERETKYLGKAETGEELGMGCAISLSCQFEG